jgi:methylphosphotriester-DNA--protein-cysteine methyltransferase
MVVHIPCRLSDTLLLSKEHASSLLHTRAFFSMSQMVQAPVRLRLDRAAMLLHEASMSIDQIAQQGGFWDRNYFSKMFPQLFYDIACCLFSKPFWLNIFSAAVTISKSVGDVL